MQAQGQGIRGLGGAARAAHEPAVHGRRPSAAHDRRDQPAAGRRQVDDRLQSRADARGERPQPVVSSTATSGGRWSRRRWDCPAARASPMCCLGGRSSSDVLQRTPASPNLFVLAAGSIPPNPSEVLGSDRMQALLGDLAKHATVIIDAPPLLPVTDGAVLTHQADGALLVVSLGKTTYDLVEKALDTLDKARWTRARRRAQQGAAARRRLFALLVRVPPRIRQRLASQDRRMPLLGEADAVRPRRRLRS